MSVALDDTVYCMTGYKGFSLLALPMSETGDLSGTNKVRWKLNRGTPYVPSPVLYDKRLYFLQSNQAILTGVNAKNGSVEIERTRLPELSKSTPHWWAQMKGFMLWGASGNPRNQTFWRF